MNVLRRLGKYILLPLFLVFIGALISAYYLVDSAKMLSADGNWFDTETGLDITDFVTLGGAKQFIRIRSRDSANPVLLDLHGGPGTTQSQLSHRILRPLTEYFTLVEWDQRGSGRSAGDRTLVDTMSYDQLVDDTIELIGHLQTRLGEQKVILVGHSWGSMLGLGVVHKRPDLIHAYVGVGQALSWPGGFTETKRLLLEAAATANDAATTNLLGNLPKQWPPKNDIEAFLERIGTIQAPLVNYGSSLHASKGNNVFQSEMVLEILLSPEISLLDARHMLSPNAANKALMIDLFGRDLERDLGYAFKVPIFVFQGEHDWQTPTTLVKPWFEKIVAPHKAYVAFADSAHIIITEEPGKFLHELVEKVRPFAQ
jgi:pimeloyl-ACP methyl ester carboxylesterase